jgi:hypothetical protein
MVGILHQIPDISLISFSSGLIWNLSFKNGKSSEIKMAIGIAEEKLQQN